MVAAWTGAGAERQKLSGARGGRNEIDSRQALTRQVRKDRAVVAGVEGCRRACTCNVRLVGQRAEVAGVVRTGVGRLAQCRSELNARRTRATSRRWWRHSQLELGFRESRLRARVPEKANSCQSEHRTAEKGERTPTFEAPGS